ncbi:hypothetical protein [Bacillus sp. OxB-1]|uniref:hypothetical protein n=1 Tax=Bacillus sp. (strain OxB-1) TaxID=98228 RepID=UPI000695F864|nr:hypothetical protein [Bacillus sp. OxB-1]
MAMFLTKLCRFFLGIVFLVAGINGYFVIFGWEPFMATSPEAMALFAFDYLLIAEKSLVFIRNRAAPALLLLPEDNRFIPFQASSREIPSSNPCSSDSSIACPNSISACLSLTKNSW